MRYNRKYNEKLCEDSFTPLQEDERIYLNVPYKTKDFAKSAKCGFDAEKKLWFTSTSNPFFHKLVSLYGVNEVTSEKARLLLEEKVGNKL